MSEILPCCHCGKVPYGTYLPEDGRDMWECGNPECPDYNVGQTPTDEWNERAAYAWSLKKEVIKLEAERDEARKSARILGTYRETHPLYEAALRTMESWENRNE